MRVVARESVPWGDLDVTIPLALMVGFWFIVMAAAVKVAKDLQILDLGHLPLLIGLPTLVLSPLIATEVQVVRLRLMPGTVADDWFRPAIGSVGRAGDPYRLRRRFLGKTRWSEVASMRVLFEGPDRRNARLHVFLHNGERLLLRRGGYRDTDAVVFDAILAEWRRRGGPIEDAPFLGVEPDDPPWFEPERRLKVARPRLTP